MVLPEFGKKSTKELIIDVLQFDQPLTLTKIMNVMKKKFGVSVTFQGVRKATNQLVENGVLEKTGKEYMISKEWVWKLRDFAEQLQESLFAEKNKVREVQTVSDDLKVYTFDNMIELDVFVNILIGRWFEESPGSTYYQQAGHAYFMMGHMEEETKILEKMKKFNVDFYTLTGGKTPLDKWAASYYKNQEFHYESGAGNTNRYFAIYNDNVFQWETPPELTEAIDAVYTKAKDFKNLNVVALTHLFRKQTTLKVTVMKNAVIAEQLRKHILSFFPR